MSEVTPIRPDLPPPALSPISPTDNQFDGALHQLAQSKLFEADALIETTAMALEHHFGDAWPAGVPEFQRVLFVALRLVREAYGSLDYSTVKERAEEIAKAELAKAGGEDEAP